MALYQNRIKLRKSIKEKKNSFLLNLTFLKYYLEKKIFPQPTFDKIITKQIHEALENGQKEIRYYMYSGNILYESMEDEYKNYCNKHHKDLYYNEKVFFGAFHMVMLDFNKYIMENDIDKNHDLMVELIRDDKNGHLGTYFLIKTNF